MEKQSYLFIDGGYFTHVLDDASTKYFGGDKITLDYQALARSQTKIFYYDCLPARKANEPDETFLPRKAEQEQKFKVLRDLNGWHVNEGIATHRKRQGAQQKEVDILIAVDMLSHTHRRNMSRLSFLAGDQDFCPLVEAVVREGMYVELWFDPLHTSRDLKNSADATRELDLYTIWGFADQEFQKAHPLPTRSLQQDQTVENANIVAIGYKDGVPFARLFNGPTGLTIVNTQLLAQRYHHLMGEGATECYLKLVHSSMFGLLNWQ